MAVEVAERVVFVDEQRTIREWIVTTDTGYRAVIPECPCGLTQVLGVVWQTNEHGVADPSLPPARVHTAPKTNCICTSEECHRNYARAQRKRLCHGWHRPRVDAMVEQIRRSRFPRGPRAVGVPMSAYRPAAFVELDGAA